MRVLLGLVRVGVVALPGASLLLLGGAMLLLALLGGMPRGWRAAALTVGPVYALVGVYELSPVGRTVVPGPADPSLLDPLFALAVFAAPCVMVAVGALRGLNPCRRSQLAAP